MGDVYVRDFLLNSHCGILMLFIVNVSALFSLLLSVHCVSPVPLFSKSGEVKVNLFHG